MTPAAYQSSTIPKSAPAKAPEDSTEFFSEDQEKSSAMAESRKQDPFEW